jgi:hypothetical protein
MPLQLLYHRQNYSVGIFQAVNFIFGAYYPSIKPLIFFITDIFSEIPAITNKIFFNGLFLPVNLSVKYLPITY